MCVCCVSASIKMVRVIIQGFAIGDATHLISTTNRHPVRGRIGE